MLKLVTPGHFKLKESKVNDLRNLNSPSIVQCEGTVKTRRTFFLVQVIQEWRILMTLELHEEELNFTRLMFQ